MRLDDLPDSGNVEDRRSEGGGGGGFGLPIGGGGLGIGTVVVLGLVGWALGIDPSLLIGGAEMLNRQTQPQVQAPPTSRRTGAPQDEMGRFVSRVLGSTEMQWKNIFSKDGKSYRAPVLVLYRDRTNAQCGGVAQAAMGPFYCPADYKIYLDTGFFEQIATRFRGCDVGSKSCQFAQAYVIAHEVGHHVQNSAADPSQGAAGATRSPKQGGGQPHSGAGRVASRLPGRGVGESRERNPEESGQAALHRARRRRSRLADGRRDRRRYAAKKVAGYVVPDSFTHGSAEQRQRWFTTGYRSGSLSSCNTFASAQL